MIKLSICGTSDLVFPYNQYGNTGHIHSFFSNSFNIEIGQRLIHVSGLLNFISSFGIVLSPNEFNQLIGIRKGDLVILKESKILIYSQSNQFQLVNHEKTTIKMQVQDVELEIQELKGIEAVLEEYLSHSELGINKDLAFQRIEAILSDTKTDKSGVRYAVDYLIGRGIGLTPSGDDILLGYLWGRRMFRSQLQDSIFEEILNESSNQTTLISKEYLSAFLKDRVSLPIYETNKFISLRDFLSVEKSIKKIGNIGHTSGADFLFGFQKSIQSIINMKK